MEGSKTLSKLRGVRKSSSTVSTADELRAKLLSAKEKLQSPTRPKSAVGLIERIKSRELGTASSVKSTSPTKWKVESTKRPRKSPKLTSKGTDVTREYCPFSSPTGTDKTSDSEDQMLAKDAT